MHFSHIVNSLFQKTTLAHVIISCRNLIILLSLLIFSSSCKSDSEFVYFEENSKIFIDSLTFKFIEEVSFPLDSMTAMTSFSVGFHEDNIDNKRYYSMLSATETFINVYDYDTKKMVKRIDLNQEGPNGVGFGNGLMAHKLINLDSVLIYNYYLLTLLLLDGEGNLKSKYLVQDKFTKGQDEAIPFPSTRRPIHVVDHIAYLMGSLIKPDIIDRKLAGMVISIDLNSGLVKRTLPRSEVYDHGNWESHNLKNDLFGDFNSLTGRFIYSFAADPFVYETDHHAFLDKHYVGSADFKRVLPLSNNRLEKYVPKKVEYYDKTTGGFHKIIFDKYNNLYYRLCFLPLTESEYVPTTGIYNAKESIIILDKNFKKIGEFFLTRFKYEFYNFFLTKEGLHLKLKPEMHENDDQSIYHVFNVVPNS